MRANYHTHCDYCDGHATAGDMAKAAKAAGFDILGFSSHAPLGRDIYAGNMKRERLGDYVREIRTLGREWEGRGLEILLGLEVDWLAGTQAPGDALFAGLGLDYKIGAVHLVDLGYGPFSVDNAQEKFDAHVVKDAGGDPSRIWKAYYRELGALIEAGGFDILGHFDLIVKNNPDGRWFDMEDPAYVGTALEAARLLAGKGIVAEINYGGISRRKTKLPYPALFVLRELHQLGVPITFSADAHRPEHLGSHLDESRELARAAGYKSVAVLTKGAWIEIGIDES